MGKSKTSSQSSSKRSKTVNGLPRDVAHKIEDETINEMRLSGQITEDELKEMGLPTSFQSTKGKQCMESPVEASRVLMARNYKQVLRKKLKSWQIQRMKKARSARSD